MEIRITHIFGSKQGQTQTFATDTHEEISIGRHPSTEITFADPAEVDTVSRRHAAISFHHGAYWITDLSSSNGTFVNETRIQKEKELRNGDVIEFGRGGPKVQVELSAVIDLAMTGVPLAIPQCEKTGSGIDQDRGLLAVPMGQKTFFRMISHALEQASSQKRSRLGDTSVFMREMVRQAVLESSTMTRMVLISCGVLVVLLVGWMIYQDLSRRAEDTRLVGLLQAEYQSRLEKIQSNLNQEISSWEQERGGYENLVARLQGELGRAKEKRDARRVQVATRELEYAVAQQRQIGERVNEAKKSYAAVKEKAIKELKTFSSEATRDLDAAVGRAQETLAALTTTMTAPPAQEAGSTSAATAGSAQTEGAATTIDAPPGQGAASMAAETPEGDKSTAKTENAATPEADVYIKEFPRLRISRPFATTPLKQRIAIAPIINPAAGAVNVAFLPDLLGTILDNTGEFLVVPYREKQAAPGADPSGQEADPASPPQTIVKILVTDVLEETSQSNRNFGLLFFNVDIGSAKTAAKLMLDMKVYDFDSGSLLLSRSLIGEGLKKKTDVNPGFEGIVRVGAFSADGFSGTSPAMVTAMSKVLSQMSEIIVTRLRHESWRGLIIQAKGEAVVLNGGDDANMLAGDTFSVWAKEENPTDPKGGTSLVRHLERRVGTLRVEEVKEKHSVARIVDRDVSEFPSGYSVRYLGVTKVLAPGESEELLPEETLAGAAPRRLLTIIDKKVKPKLDPSSDAKEVKNVEMKKGDVLEWDLSLGEWYKMKLDNNRSGWVHQSQIEVSSPEKKPTSK